MTTEVFMQLQISKLEARVDRLQFLISTEGCNAVNADSLRATFIQLRYLESLIEDSRRAVRMSKVERHLLHDYSPGEA